MFDPLVVRSALDLPAKLPVRVDAPTALLFRLRGPLVYSLGWLREPRLGKLLGDAGHRTPAHVEIDHDIMLTAGLRHEVSLDDAGRLRLRLMAKPRADTPEAVMIMPGFAVSHRTLPTLNGILSMLGPGPGADGTRLMRSIVEQAVDAAADRRGAELCRLAGSARDGAPLADCSFPFTDEGLAVFRAALEGDYTFLNCAAVAGGEIRPAPFAEFLQRDTIADLQFPFLDRNWRKANLVAGAEWAASRDGRGRVFVGPSEEARRSAARTTAQATLALAATRPCVRASAAEAFTIAYADRRRLPRAAAPALLAPLMSAYGIAGSLAGILKEPGGANQGEVDVELSLTIPGVTAAAWWETPVEDSSAFFSVYSRASLAIQHALRLWLPYLCFSDSRRPGFQAMAAPLVVYAASRPYVAKPAGEFTHDLLSDSWREVFFHSAGKRLPGLLKQVHRWLMACGNPREAARFDRHNAARILSFAERRPRRVRALLASEAFLCQTLIALGGDCRRLAAGPPPNPYLANLAFCRLAESYTRAVNGRMRRFYAGKEFLGLGGLLFLEATRAVGRAMGRREEIQAVLRVADVVREGVPEEARLWVNRAGAEPVAPAA